MKRGTKGLARTAWKRKPTPRATAKTDRMRDALDLHFFLENAMEPATCQACGKILPRLGAQAHHKRRASARGMDSPENLLAVHPLCHAWIHLDGSRGAQETIARESALSIATGGTVDWPENLKAKLNDYLRGGTLKWTPRP